MDPTYRLFDLPITSMSMTGSLDLVMSWLEQPEQHRAFFLNAHCVNVAHVDRNYRQALQQSDAIFPDGLGVKIAGLALKCPIRENVNGTDMFPLLCARLAEGRKRLYLLGGTQEVVIALRNWCTTHYPGLKVCGYHHGYFDETDHVERIAAINSARPDLLLVAMGVPKQEIWIHRYFNQTTAKVAMGVGGLFDFYSGRIPRAPLWMRQLGQEWVFRLIQEPKRLWKRYLIGNFVFLARVFHYKVTRAGPDRYPP